MKPRISAWSLCALLLALAGPAAVAIMGVHVGGDGPRIVAQLLGIAAIATIVAIVLAVAIRVDGYALRQLGFGGPVGPSLVIGLVLATFFIVAYGPLVAWATTQLGVGGFEDGLGKIADQPIWLLVLTILVVAPAEEIPYRAYAITRLGALLGRRWPAAVVALIAFFLAHVPLWGWSAAATTLVSGGIVTLVYLWRADVVALILAHVLTDLVGLVAPRLGQ